MNEFVSYIASLDITEIINAMKHIYNELTEFFSLLKGSSTGTITSASGN